MNFLEAQGKTAAELLEHAETLAEVLRSKGYNRVDLSAIRLESMRIVFSFDTIDEFQRDLDYSDRVQSGFSRDFISGKDEPNDSLELVRAVKSRARREFEVMCRRMGGLIEFKDQLVSAAGRAFVEDLETARSKWLALEGPKD